MSSEESLSVDSDLASDEEDLDEGLLTEEISKIKERLRRNPASYDDLVALIGLYSKTDDFDQLRHAREEMYKRYPLTPELWLAWIGDELKLAVDIPEKRALEHYFVKALGDYKSVQVWLEYCQFAIAILDLASPESLEHSRNIFNSAVAQGGLDFDEGYLLFDIFREFEKLLLANLGESDEKRILAQVKRIEAIYLQQLRVPSRQLTQCMEEYKTFLEGMASVLDHAQVSDSVQLAYDQALAKSRQMQKFENATPQKDWLAYADFILANSSGGNRPGKKGDSGQSQFSPFDIESLFERAVTADCLNGQIWQAYSDWLQLHMPSNVPLISQTHARAIRNVPWMAELWLRNAISLEQQHQPVAEMFESALKLQWPDAGSLATLWTAYIDWQLRQPSDTTMQQNLRELCQRATSHLGSAFGHGWDLDLPVYKYWALIEAKHLKEPSKGAEVWQKVMRIKGHGSNMRCWIEYIDFCKVWHETALDKVCSQCINSISDVTEAEQAFYLCLRAQAEAGATLDQVNVLRAKILQRRVHLKSLPQKPEQQPVKETIGKKRLASVASTMSVAPAEKRPKQQAAPKEVKPQHHGEFVAHDPSKNPITVFVSNLDYSVTEAELESRFQEIGPLANVRLVKDYAGRSKGFAYVEFTNVQDRARALAELDRKPVSTDKMRPMFVSECDPDRSKDQLQHKPFKFAANGVEKNKLFVRGFDKSLTETHLLEFFSRVAKPKSVRLVTYRNGTPKGLAYVEFDDANVASKVLVATDGHELQGQVIQVALSNPPPRGDCKFKEKPQPEASSMRQHARSQLSLMPRALSSKISHAKPSTSNSNGSSSRNEEAAPSKSNADFRNMFLTN